MGIDATNADRRRWYGVRAGDTVEFNMFGRSLTSVVSSLHPLDNNACFIDIDGKNVKAVCEWLNVIQRVEE